MCLSFIPIMLTGILSSNREWWSQTKWKQAPDFEESEVRRPSRPWTRPSARRRPITTHTDHRHHGHLTWGPTCPHRAWQAHWCVSSCVCVCNDCPPQVRPVREGRLRHLPDLQELSAPVWVPLLPGLRVQERYWSSHARSVSTRKTSSSPSFDPEPPGLRRRLDLLV